MKTEQSQPKKISHALTAAQHKYCRELVGQMGQIEGTLRGFLNYVVLENQLPPAAQGYRLSPDMMSLEGEVAADKQ